MATQSIHANLVATIAVLALEELTHDPHRRARFQTPREAVPRLTEELRARYGAQVELIAGTDTRPISGDFTLTYLFAIPKQAGFIIVDVAVPANDPAFPSIATQSYMASRCEREIHDLLGLVPQDHPDLRRLPLHQFWPQGYYPLRKDATPPADLVDDGQPYPFRRVEGEGLYEVTVGPVHAGIIEPGHFRFTVEGETIVNLESRLYFVHKGIEKLFESLPLPRTVALAERISGDSSVAHILAYCQAIEAIAGIGIPPRAALIRVVLLELERIYNHIMDVGMICTDAGFAFAQAHASRLREDLLRLNARLSGQRLLRGMLTPGGLAHEPAQEPLDSLRVTLARVHADFEEVVAIALNNTLLLDRLHATGRLFDYTAREMQVVGVVGRASGIDADVRRDHPFAAYGQLQFQVPVYQEGDVWARTMVRIDEVRQSVALIGQALDQLEPGRIAAPLHDLPPYASALGLVEGWRGPIMHWVIAGPDNTIYRCKIKDPSFANWPALNYAVLTNIVPDFPLCNKSFNLSYAGNDL